MATLHLEKLKDGQAYADCYKEMVVKNPSTENLLLLGDAYMAIQVCRSIDIGQCHWLKNKID